MSDDGLSEITCIVTGGIATAFNMIEIMLLVRKGKQRSKADEITLSLSCADMLVGIASVGVWSIALETGKENKNITKVIASVLLIFCFNTSVFHILTIAVDRFYAVRHPIKYRAVMTKQVTRKMIIGLWVLSISIITSFAVPDILNSSNLLGVFKGIFIFTTGIIVVICYGYLGYVIWRRGKFISSAAVEGKTNDIRSQKQLRDTIFSYLIASSYIICSFPFAIVMVARTKNYKIAGLMLVVNSLIDPIFYFWKGYCERYYRENRLKALVDQENGTTPVVTTVVSPNIQQNRQQCLKDFLHI